MRRLSVILSNRHSKGFSLIEILLVVILLSIVAVLIIPNFSQSYESLILSKTTESIADLMRYAQSRSVMNNHAVNLIFEEDFSRYQLFQFDSESNAFVAIANRLGKSFETPSNLTVSSEVTTIGFYPDGTIDPAEVSVCASGEDSERCYTVSSKVQRGFIKILEKENDS